MNTQTDISPTQRLKIWQQNVNTSLISHLAFISTLRADSYDIAMIQELHVDFKGNSRSLSHWYPIYPSTHKKHPGKTRALTLVNSRIPENDWQQMAINSGDITQRRPQHTNHNQHLQRRGTFRLNTPNSIIPTTAHQRINPTRIIFAGDFNRHSPLWDEERNKQLFTTENLGKNTNSARPALGLRPYHGTSTRYTNTTSLRKRELHSTG